MNPPVPLEQAQEALLDLVTPLPVETCGTADSLGRNLASAVKAIRTQPAADLSAMDGYAVREGETGPWAIVGESAAGHPFRGTLNQDEAIRISTGALMPDGADAVLLQENARRDGDRLTLNGEGFPTPRHIRRKGFDFEAGAELLRKGTSMGPAQIALALAAGHGKVGIHALPELAIIDSGDELSLDPAHCESHQIPASNGAMIAAMASPLCSKIHRQGPVPDKMESLLDALEQSGAADVIVTSGGASVGDHDLVRPALEQWGATIEFWRVAMKPGKPVMVARKGKQIILGLPGNPVSSYVTAYLFLLPLLRKLAGAKACLPRRVNTTLDGELEAGGNRLEFVRGWFDGASVRPFPLQDSSALRMLACSNSLIVRPPDCAASSSGSNVPVYLLQNGGNA